MALHRAHVMNDGAYWLIVVESSGPEQSGADLVLDQPGVTGVKVLVIPEKIEPFMIDVLTTD